jgi:hypothetical protein
MTTSSNAGTLPPTRPVLPPCGTTARRRMAQCDRMRDTWSVLLGRSASRDRPWYLPIQSLPGSRWEVPWRVGKTYYAMGGKGEGEHSPSALAPCTPRHGRPAAGDWSTPSRGSPVVLLQRAGICHHAAVAKDAPKEGHVIVIELGKLGRALQHRCAAGRGPQRELLPRCARWSSASWLEDSAEHSQHRRERGKRANGLGD